MVFLLFNLANLLLIARILQAVQPRQLLAGLGCMLWNPIVIAYGQSKVDTVMVFFLLLAALALVQEKRKLVVIALGVSALVKLITLPLIAVYWLYTLRSRRPTRAGDAFIPAWADGDRAVCALLVWPRAAEYAAAGYWECCRRRLEFLCDCCCTPALYSAYVWIGLRRDGMPRTCWPAGRW